MFKREIIIEALPTRTRLAVLEAGTLCEYAIFYEGEQRAQIGDVFAGRVTRTMPHLRAAFVDIGLEKQAFMPLQTQFPTKNGDLVCVQVEKDPVGEEKGLKITQALSFSGELVVLTLGKDTIAVSTKITDKGERERLRSLVQAHCPQGCGIIVRTQAQGKEEEAIAAEIAQLHTRLVQVQARFLGQVRPGKFCEQLPGVQRLVGELLPGVQDVCVVCDDEALCAALRKAYPRYAQGMECRAGSTLLFDAYRLDEKISKAFRRRVYLKSGASIVIDRCEAMTVIDVNSAKSAAKESALQVNIEAAWEIARQLRLRDMGGIIVVDFIDLPDEESREALLGALREATKEDRSRVRFSGISPLGLCEMTRKCLGGKRLEDILFTPCKACAGEGERRSAKETAYALLLELKRRVASGGQGTFLLRVHGAVLHEAQALFAQGEHAAGITLYAMEERGQAGYTLTAQDRDTMPAQAKEMNTGREKA